MNTDYGKESFRKFQELPTVVTPFTFVTLHLRTVYFPDHVLFYIHDKCLRISINGHFSVVLTRGVVVPLISWHRKSCLILCHVPAQFNHHLTSTIRESILGSSTNKFISRSKFGRITVPCCGRVWQFLKGIDKRDQRTRQLHPWVHTQEN